MSRDRTAALLRVRGLDRDGARGRLLAALAAEREAAERRDALTQLLAHTRPAARTGAELTAAWQLSSACAGDATAAGTAAEAAATTVQATRGELVDADRQLSAVERWDARRRAERASERRSAEQKAADELSSARHGLARRRRGGTP